MQASADSQLYELNRVEDAFIAILVGAGLGSSQDIQGKRSTNTNITPRVELHLESQQHQGRRYLRYPAAITSLVQPLNTWIFRLVASIVTNRKEGGHEPLVGKVRQALQYYALTQTWTEGVAPFHVVTDIREDGEECSFTSDDNIDVSRLVFGGMFNIRDNSWPVDNFILMDGSNFLFMNGDRFLLAA